MTFAFNTRCINANACRLLTMLSLAMQSEGLITLNTSLSSKAVLDASGAWLRGSRNVSLTRFLTVKTRRCGDAETRSSFDSAPLRYVSST